MVGVGTYKSAGAKLCKIIGPRFPVVVIDITNSFLVIYDIEHGDQ
jgi:hypothetical protein